MSEQDTLLLVDDQESNRATLRSFLEDEYNLLEAENGEQALLLLEQYQSKISAVLLDAVMPGKDGYAVLNEMERRGLLSKVPVVMVNIEGALENEERALRLGASDIISKPFTPYVVRQRVRNIVELNCHKLHLEELAEIQAQDLRQSSEAIVDALSSVIEYRNLESGRHVRRIRMFMRILLEDLVRTCPEYGLNARNVELIASASALHDIGKIAIPDSILGKPGKLSAEEFEVMKSHTWKGCEILESLDKVGEREYLQYAWEICRWHHERWDGGGYPDGLQGEEIPVWAQVAGIADTYDALTTDRAYKRAFSHERAMNMILNGKCGVFSPKLLECLKNVRNAFHSQMQRWERTAEQEQSVTVKPGQPEQREKIQTIWNAQTKYQALLRYAKATAVEVDLDSGIYHIVYEANLDFARLRAESTFLEAMRDLADTMVHPEDREAMWQDLQHDLKYFFEDGLMKQTRRYRIYSGAVDGYRLYEAAMVRIDNGRPGHRHCLFLWKETENQPRKDLNPALRSLLGGVICCRNDCWYTMVGAVDGLSALVGYPEEELKERFQNRLLALIHPDDREEARHKTGEQLQRTRHTEMEYRMCHKDGRVIWVLEKSRMVEGEDGQEYLYCVLMDVTQTKQAQERLRLTLERHQLIMDQTNDIIFEWDLATDSVTYSSNWEKKFGYEPIRSKISQTIPVASHIYPEDIPEFLGKMRSLRSGTPYEEVEIRIAKADGHYLWCRVRATAQNGKDGLPLKAVGVILDIDREKRATQALREKAQTDALTKLFNKAYGRRVVEEYLEGRPVDEQAALLIIDVDDFKQVNDRYGHMFGDAALTAIADEIRKLFRNMDVISRIGGDEFTVFLKGIPDRHLVEMRCAQLIQAFQQLFQEQLPELHISCSIGVALVPQHGTAFQELFQRGDQALYQAKSLGKDRFQIYQGPTSPGPLLRTEAPLAAGTRIDSDEQPGMANHSLVQYALRRLYESGDVEATVEMLLETVGQQFNVSRVYIFENTRDNQACNNTFEWCNTDIEPQKENLQQVSYEKDLGGTYEANFDENGVFYCADVATLPKPQYEVLKPQRVKSMLQCAIRDGGKFRGFVGFDECVTNRLWTQEQISALTLLSELISVFLLKKRAQDETAQRVWDLERLLDSQNAWVYVIDPETYRLQFINAKTLVLTPQAKVGMYCYQAFVNRDAPCDNCPARDIRRLGRNSVIFFNDYLDITSLADASLIQWSGTEACLISCHDISLVENRQNCSAEKTKEEM